MSLSWLACPKCGTKNAATATYCSSCGNLLVNVPSLEPFTPSPAPLVPATSPPGSSYGYAAGYSEAARATGIDRTKTGLLLVVIGFLISWIPVVGIVGVVLELVGAILVTLGRHVFGHEHARNVIWSIIISVVAIGVAVVAGLVVVFSVIANFQPSSTNPLPPSFASSFIGVIFVAVLFGVAIFGIAEVLFTYALQTSNGRILLWCGYASTIATSIITFFVLNNIPNVSVISIVPAIFYGYAYYLARERIVHGEIPTPLTPLQGR